MSAQHRYASSKQSPRLLSWSSPSAPRGFRQWNGNPRDYPRLAREIKDARFNYPEVFEYLDGTAGNPERLSISNMSALIGSSVTSNNLPPSSNSEDLEEDTEEHKDQKQDPSSPSALDLSQSLAGRSLADQEILLRMHSLNSTLGKENAKLKKDALTLLRHLLSTEYLTNLRYCISHFLFLFPFDSYNIIDCKI